MAKLAVNVDHVATLREARQVNYPDPVAAAVLAELAGADGIVVHLREDRRHIQDRDVRIIRDIVKTKLILEMASTPEMVPSKSKFAQSFLDPMTHCNAGMVDPSPISGKRSFFVRFKSSPFEMGTLMNEFVRKLV